MESIEILGVIEKQLMLLLLLFENGNPQTLIPSQIDGISFP